MVKREEVFSVIDDERNYQDEEWPGNSRSVAHELVLLNRYVTQANEEWADNSGDAWALQVIRKIAAISVRCMENNGAPYRSS